MLTYDTLKQILEVLKKVREYHAGGLSFIKAYQKAVDDVRISHQVYYQTIADGCTRRLQLKRDGFLVLVEDWLTNNSDGLCEHLKKHVDDENHLVVDEFFQRYTKKYRTDITYEKRDANEIKRPIDRKINVAPETEILSFRIEKRIVDQIKVLAEIKGKSIPEWLSETVDEKVKAEYLEHFKQVIGQMSEQDKKSFIEMLKSNK